MESVCGQPLELVSVGMYNVFGVNGQEYASGQLKVEEIVAARPALTWEDPDGMVRS